VGESGFVEFEYQTQKNVDREGTWTLIATQEKNKELIYVGYNVPPSTPINLKFDKLNYKSGDIAVISLTGKPSEIIKLLILDPSDNPVGNDISITLEPDGTRKYELDLLDYSSGIYTAVILRGSAQSEEKFSVGLQTGSGEIKINTAKLIPYLPGDLILILGNTGSNALLIVTLIDPDGNEVKVKEIFSDKEGVISEKSFRIPSNAKAGMWSINAKSGSNFDTIEIEVLSTLQEGIQVSIKEGIKIPGFGHVIEIVVEGAVPKASVFIEIRAENGDVIDDSLKCSATSGSSCVVPWTISKNVLPGIYTVIVVDSLDSAKTTFTVN